ncbi:amidohydrolase family protein [Selenomonas sp. TAMA-11512]|uniref:amidohydrolase family protein n=1 Tax=Selenomonas sp. TAMA-11512 TaxID=3095337 RepID=UPI0030892840|nr:amidohydrolase family protein [Selenomonas sp. TAMA-11512]
MKIIDAHLHFCEEEYFDTIAATAGHANTAEHLMSEYERLGIAGGVVMGNRSLEPAYHARYPKKLRYCIGVDTSMTGIPIPDQVEKIEENLKLEACVGVKLYPGYSHFYVYDETLDPVYELAKKYDKPVAVHTGLTATDHAVLKYAHPLTLDEAAVRHPGVQFVMCHFGNPFLEAAVAVVEKNPNVAVDLSGLIEGKITDMDRFSKKKKGYLRMINDWLEYMNLYDRFMYGTDWPLANIEDYIAFLKLFIPEEEWEKVFFRNANCIYGLGL